MTSNVVYGSQSRQDLTDLKGRTKPNRARHYIPENLLSSWLRILILIARAFVPAYRRNDHHERVAHLDDSMSVSLLGLLLLLQQGGQHAFGRGSVIWKNRERAGATVQSCTGRQS